MGSGVSLIDSAEHTAGQVAEVIAKRAEESDKAPEPGGVCCFVSDNPERFTSLGAKFLHEPLGQVRYVPLDALIADPGGALGVLASGNGGRGLDNIVEMRPTTEPDQSRGVG